MTEKRMTDDELAEEARRWDQREVTPAGWVEAPEAIPRAKESMQINIRLPCQMVAILKEFARRSGIGYQVLMKRWLDERIRQERERFRQEQERLRRQREGAERPTGHQSGCAHIRLPGRRIRRKPCVPCEVRHF